ncbi:PREDICTED: uncharacterized protein LOC105361295 isoform X2 [Ceratosolen solmsi marchali]|uniref:Uncharacterized protein LOC105361295 isoform X2 n=1 Tax=Ceratosolen solmsi marchali TaxID=326594 RepID=A0AAJ7DUC6_9HYME|nr:PREDICTED: uncharacterized protein LOC105361295 isoform X2 [Ceratosolen solmsi marchali]
MRRADHQQALLAILINFLIWQVATSDRDVRLTHDGPVVLGGIITFRADLLDSDGQAPSGSFIYTWKDNALDQHFYQTATITNTTMYYSVSYPASKYHVGEYTMEVAVCKWLLFIQCREYTSRRIYFHVTALFNGNLNLEQSNKTVQNNFISSAEVTNLSVDLRKGDIDYINKTATSILTYWFVDCKFYNKTDNFKTNYNFTLPNSFHIIEALVVASFDSPTTIAPIVPTSSIASTNVTSVSLNIASTISTTPLTTTSIAPNSSIISNTSNKTLPELGIDTFPFVCKSVVEPNINKVYGYFQREVKIRAPISKLSVEGSTWIQPWNSLSLIISCNGTGPFHKCIKIHIGKYNVTGNETCNQDAETLDTCKFSFNHYFLDALEYTVLVILSNDVSTDIHPVAVNIYKLTPKPQLSVIVVPVSCSLVAVVLIVFGIAYYIQSRARFTVEVADFDFGRSNPDMEYKTFTERLRDSFNNAGYKQLNNTKDLQ